MSNRAIVFFVFFMSILLPWLFVLLVRAYGPIEFPDLNGTTVTYLFFYVFFQILFFVILFVLSRCYFSDVADVNGIAECEIPSRTFLRVRQFFLLSAIIYPAVALFDFYVFKDGSLSQIVQIREREHLSGPRGTLIGAVGALFASAPPLALALYMLHPVSSFVKRITFMSIIVIGFGCMFLSGGRNAFFISSVFVFIFIFIFVSKKQLNNAVGPLLRLAVYVLIAFGFVFSMQIFLQRFEEQGMETADMVSYLSSEYSVRIAPHNEGSIFGVSIYSALVYLVFYMTHSFTYLDQYFLASYSPDLLGVYNFPLLARVADLLFSASYFSNGIDRLILKGVYLTQPGSLYVDFGFFGGLVVGAFLGAVYGFLASKVCELKLYQKILLAFLSVQMIFAPFYSVVSIANGFSFLAFLIFVIILSLRFKGVSKSGLSDL